MSFVWVTLKPGAPSPETGRAMEASFVATDCGAWRDAIDAGVAADVTRAIEVGDVMTTVTIEERPIED